MEVAAYLFNLFHSLGLVPTILQSGNSKEFCAQIIKELVQMCPSVKIINERPCHPQFQSLEEIPDTNNIQSINCTEMDDLEDTIEMQDYQENLNNNQEMNYMSKEKKQAALYEIRDFVRIAISKIVALV
ncbi:17193_t:CDS:2 [Gigaspora margarita]|uniref:17193_t:CDS:1 n=1 Tax=Gigaspora margarita TaxID=4874 RepID=A0ABN7VAJ5_GIGMA|nr:17193_t:CDS:2 [Gigaspora margarita]